MKLSAFDFDLPDNLIAEHPVPNRDESRLMVLNREKQTIEHKVFKDVEDLRSALKRVQEDETLRNNLERQGRQKIIDQYQPEQFDKVLVELLNSF